MSNCYISSFRIGRRAVLRHRLVTPYDLHKLLCGVSPAGRRQSADFCFAAMTPEQS